MGSSRDWSVKEWKTLVSNSFRNAAINETFSLSGTRKRHLTPMAQVLSDFHGRPLLKRKAAEYFFTFSLLLPLHEDNSFLYGSSPGKIRTEIRAIIYLFMLQQKTCEGCKGANFKIVCLWCLVDFHLLSYPSSIENRRNIAYVICSYYESRSGSGQTDIETGKLDFQFDHLYLASQCLHFQNSF